MVQDTTITPRVRLEHRLLLLCLILGIGVVVYWLLRPQPVAMRLVGCNPLVCPGFTAISTSPSREYIFCRDSYNKATCFNWDGTRLWSVTIPKPILPPVKQRNNPYGTGVKFSISPDGHVFAAVVAQSDHYNVYTWRDGRLLGVIRLPLGSNQPSVQSLSSGQVFTWSKETSRVNISLIEGKKIVAYGSVRTPFGTRPVFESCRFSSDGQVFICRETSLDGPPASPMSFIYHTVHISDSRLDIQAKYIAYDPAPFILHNNMLITYNGAIYNDHVRISPPDNWSILYADAPYSDAVIQGKLSGAFDVQPQNVDKIRILIPHSGKSWSPQQCLRQLFAISPDGEYLLSDETPAVTTAISDLFENISNANLPIISDGIPRIERYNPNLLMLYQRPGYKRAYIPYRQSGDGWCIEQKYVVLSAKLSHDGRNINLLAYTHDEQYNDQYYILRYTW